MKILKILIVATLAMVANNSKAQDIKLEFSLGASIPLGDYGDNDPDNRNARYAEPGSNVSISLESKISDNIGAKFLINRQINSIDANTLLSGYMAEFGKNGDYEANTVGFKITNIMGGGAFNFRFGDSKLSSSSQILAGISIVNSPEIALTFRNGPLLIQNEQKSGRKSGLGLMVGTKINYDFTDSFGISIGADFYHTSIEFSNIEITEFNNNGTQIDQTDFNADISTLNTNLGVYFTF